MLTPPITGNDDLDSFLYDLTINGVEGSGGGGITESGGLISLPDGTPLGYKHQYIAIKYADGNTGLNISDSPTNKLYYGVANIDTPTEPTNPAQYTWYKVDGTFGTTRQLYYQVYGGRNIKFTVDTSAPSYKWLIDNGLVIDLDNIVPTATISSSEILANAVTELQLADAAVTAAKTAIAAIDPTSGNLEINSVTTNSIQAGAIVADKIAADSVTADKINVMNLAAINANLGAINAGSLNINNKFIVESNGNATIRSATTGARVEIKNNTIKVYDNAGILRVHIGDLSA